MEQKLNATTFFTFKLGTQNFAIELLKIVKCDDFLALKTSKTTHEHFLGELMFNDYELPVLNIRKQLGLPSLMLNQLTGVAVINHFNGDKNIEFGIIFDALDSIVEVKSNEIMPFNIAGRKNNNKLISGIVKSNDSYYLVFDMQKLVTQNFSYTKYPEDKVESEYHRVVL